MIIPNMQPFVGQHCETTATGTLLKQNGIELSEPMLFGLGEGLSFIYWNMKTMDFPFIGGRVKPDVLTENICRNLQLTLAVAETASKKKAWANVVTQLERGTAVGLKLDSYHLDYFSTKIHFAGHYVAMVGYDDHDAYLVDTEQQGGRTKTSLKSLEMARNEKGPMSSRNKSYTIFGNGVEFDLREAVATAIGRNAHEYLNPPIKNVSYKGILKTSHEIINWFKNSKDIKGEFQTCAMLMERAGTGGALFRNFYRDFLQESYQLLQINVLKQAYEAFVGIANQWSAVSELLYQAGETEDIAFIYQASDLLRVISEQERRTMVMLAGG